jgi:hypothetical protein
MKPRALQRKTMTKLLPWISNFKMNKHFALLMVIRWQDEKWIYNKMYRSPESKRKR